jgi:hypothetical protein
MKTRAQLLIVAALVVVSPQLAAAVSLTPAEMRESRRWVAAKLEGVEDKKKNGYDTEPFFSFTYDLWRSTVHATAREMEAGAKLQDLKSSPQVQARG